MCFTHTHTHHTQRFFVRRIILYQSSFFRLFSNFFIESINKKNFNKLEKHKEKLQKKKLMNICNLFGKS